MTHRLQRRPVVFLGLVWLAWVSGYGALPLWAGTNQAEDRRAQASSDAASGWRLLKSGDATKAARSFAKAIDLMPNEASFYVGMGTAYVKLLKEDEAEGLFTRAIELDPNATTAHALLGDLTGRKGDWEGAIRHYRIAIRQDPNDVTLQERLRSAQANHRAEADLDRLYVPHFVVKFYGANDRMLAREVADRLEAIYQDIGVTLGHFPAKPLEVVLYPAGRFQEVTAGPEWARGLFDGTLRFSIENLRGRRMETERSLRHEYAHALVYELAGGHAPAWLNEGLAQVLDGRPAATPVKPVGDPDALTPLHFLHGSFVGLTRETAQQAYADSYAATQVLIARHGMSRVRTLLVALADQPDFGRTFELVMQERYRDFESAWTTAQTGRRF